MADTATGKKSKGNSFVINILKKLKLGEDLSVNRVQPETGMFKHWWNSFKSNYGSLVVQNLMVIVFALPLIALLVLMPMFEQKFILDNAFNFVGDLGLGFTGATTDTFSAIKGIYIFRILFYLLIIPCFSLVGIGFSGVFYSSRNVVWGAKVKIRHYFRGLKKYWWKFMLAFTVIGIATYGVIGSIYGYLYLTHCGMTNWYMWLVMIFACLFALLVIYFMLIYLPTVTMYNFKHGEIIKNSIYMGIVLIFPSTLIAIVMALPIVALAMISITKIILYVILVLFGLSAYAVAIQSYGQYACDAYINPLYEQSVAQEERNRRRVSQENKRNSGKKNKKNKK